MNRLPSIAQKKDYRLVIFLIASFGLHAGAILLADYLKPPPIPDAAASIEIEITGEPDKPPPLGTNDAETGPPPADEPTPPPVPEDTPPPPVVPSDFDVPEDKPTPAPKAAPKPKSTPSTQPASTPAFNPKARPGAIKGVDAAHGGVAGGVGQVKSTGGNADFLSQPVMPVPYNLRQRLAGFKGFATATITYAGGNITNVVIAHSSGNDALDSALVRHVRANFRVKPGVSGAVTKPVRFSL